MPDINVLAVVVATIVVFALSGIYYTVFGTALAAVSQAAASGGSMPPWKIAAELGRSLLLATVVTGLARYAEIDGLGAGVLLGVALWIGFPFVLWTGAMLHENEPLRLAAIHAGDWLLKLIVLAAIASVWR